MKNIFIVLLLLYSYIHADTIQQNQYNKDKTWKDIDSKEVLESKTKQLEAYYKQVDKQSKEKNYIRFNGKRVISHAQFSQLSLGEMHSYSAYIVFSEFYIQWVSPHNQLNGVSVGGILSDEIGDKKAKIRYFKFAQRYYSTLHELGRGTKVYAYCAAPYITNCILTGIGEKW